MLTAPNTEHHMAGFTKLFASITESTIWQAPDATRIVWITMLAMADQNGYVGASVPGLAGRARVTMPECLDALQTFLDPDQWSRTKDFEGRRISEVDGGWMLLNHAKYRAKLDAVDRREQARVGMAKYRAKLKKSLTVNHVNTGERSLTQAEAEAEALNTNPATQDSPQALLGDCPHGLILDLWAEVLPSMPQHEKHLWRGTRADHLRARWRETAIEKKWPDQAAGLAYLRKLFVFVGKSQFLTGRAPSNGKRTFQIELEWLVNPNNWAKVIEGKYHETQQV